MKKIFFHIYILSVLIYSPAQGNERSKAFNALQSKIDSLNARILSLRNNGRNSPTINSSTEKISDNTSSPVFSNKQGVNKTDDYQISEEVNSLNPQLNPFDEEINAVTAQENSQLPKPSLYFDEVSQLDYQPETRIANGETVLVTETNKLSSDKTNENESKKTGEEESQSNFIADGNSKRNSFSFYYGFTMPNKSNFRKYGIQFHEGQQFSLEYLRKFDSFFLGTTFATKVYENKKITGIRSDDTIKGRSADYIHLVETGQINAFGQNRLFALSINGGWKPNLTDRIFMKNKISMGMAFSDRELKIEEQMLTQYDMVLYYSFLSGLGIQWNNFFHTLFYYQFDGQTETERFDDQTFHELGISFGIDY